MNFRLTIVFLTSVILFYTGCEKAREEVPVQFSRTVFPERTLETKRDVRFRVFLPENRSDKLPVMLYLHGSDDRGHDNEKQLSGLVEAIQRSPATFDFAIVFPQCPEGRFWDEEMLAQSIAELDQTIGEIGADTNRVYLAGYSLGGFGVWTGAALYPGKFSALVPMSGRVLPRPGERKRIGSTYSDLTEAEDPYLAVATKIADTPVWIFHGANDNIVPVESSRRMTEALKAAGNRDVRYSELENVGHYSLDSALNEHELFRWLSQQSLHGK